MRVLSASFLFVALAAASMASADAQPPTFQPGAPGEPPREISREESLALGQSRYVAADVRFMQHMIVHHRQAVEMGALIEARTDHPQIRLMGERIALSQEAEIEMMRTWLTRRGEMTEMAVDHAGHHANWSDDASTTPLMPGMLSPAQMAALEAAEGEAFDRLFLAGMIAHHEGAIDMVNALLAEPGAGEDPELSDFLGSVVTEQSIEIARMRAMLAEIG